MHKPGPKFNRLRMGLMPVRYSFVLNPHVRERFTRCPSCNSPTRIRKLPLVVHVGQLEGPRLVLLDKTCRLCLLCETLIVHRAELERVIIASGFSAAAHGQDYVVLGTLTGALGAAELLVTRSLGIFDSTWPISRNI
jgi:hypothetical protein